MKQRRDTGKLFSLTAKVFLRRIREYAAEAGISNAAKLGTHGFRRGMAQDIVDQGGSLADLLKAGHWHSKAFFAYLRESQTEDNAIAQMIVDLSDSEPE